MCVHEKDAKVVASDICLIVHKCVQIILMNKMLNKNERNLQTSFQ